MKQTDSVFVAKQEIWVYASMCIQIYIQIYVQMYMYIHIYYISCCQYFMYSLLQLCMRSKHVEMLLGVAF